MGYIHRWITSSLLICLLVSRWMAATLALRWKIARTDRRPEYLRQFFERASGAWIKFGQLLAMRVDFLPPTYVAQLSELLDKVPPFPFEQARVIIETELGRSIQDLFLELPREPVAAASLGQVYRAIIPSGQTVALKVQRPGIDILVHADLGLLKFFAAGIDSMTLLGGIKLGYLAEELGEILNEELDYRIEAQNLRRAHDASRNIPIVKTPALIEAYCTRRVLGMEFLEGFWMKEVLKRIQANYSAAEEFMRTKGIDLRTIALRMFEVGMRQVFEKGFFHADPHSANIVLFPGNVVGYIDFGITGDMDETLAAQQEAFFKAVRDERISDAAEALTEMIHIPPRRRFELKRVQRDLREVIRDWIRITREPGTTLVQKSTARLILDCIAVFRKYRFGLIHDAMRYYRALLIADVIVLQLDPDFDFSDHLNRYFRKNQIRIFRRAHDPELARRLAAEYLLLIEDAPALIQRMDHRLSRLEYFSEELPSKFITLYRNFARASLLALLAILAARVIFGIEDFGSLLGVRLGLLDWRWTSVVCFFSWLWFRKAAEE